SVVAAGYAYGTDAGQYAVTVKLTRALMIIPVVLGIIALRSRRTAPAPVDGPSHAVNRTSDVLAGTGPAAIGQADSTRPAAVRRGPGRLGPPFLVLFLLAAAANSAGLIPTGWHNGLGLLAGYLVAVALAGIGLGVRLGELRRAGLRPLAFGGLLSLLVATSS